MKYEDKPSREPAPRLTGPLPARIVPCAAPPPDAADEDFADGSVEMNGDGSQLRVALALQAAQPLTVDRTIYVDSVAGNDANAGTQAAPFKTFDRAWAERQKYGLLRAKLTIQLLGVGPYALPQRIGGSICDVGGFLIVRGDESAEIQHATGTFSGDFTGPTIGTSAGLGSDTYKNRWVKITSGPAIGCVFLILKNTDTSITACNRRFKSIASFTITAGTTFTIFSPGTQVTVPASSRIENCRGGSGAQNTSTQDQRHIWFGLAFTGAPSVANSDVTMSLCSATQSIVSQFSSFSTVIVDGRLLGASEHAYRSAGMFTTLALNSISGFFFGPLSAGSASSLGTIGYIQHLGGRMGGVTVNARTWYEVGTTGTAGDLAFRFEGAVTVNNDSTFFLNSPSGNLVEWSQATGSCIRAARGTVIADNVVMSGGTTDLAGFGIDVSNGGRCFLRQAPTLTGGTAGKDLKTTNNGGVANSVLSAAGTAAGVAADALLGEVLARVA